MESSVKLKRYARPYAYRLVIVEGMRSSPLPKIICAQNMEQLEEVFDDRICY